MGGAAELALVQRLSHTPLFVPPEVARSTFDVADSMSFGLPPSWAVVDGLKWKPVGSEVYRFRGRYGCSIFFLTAGH